MTLYGAAKAPGTELREAGTTVVALTDDSTGTASETIAAAVNTASLTDNSGGTASDTLAVSTNHSALTDTTGGATVTTLLEIVPGGSGATGGAFSSEVTRDAAIVIMNDNAKALVVGNIAQRLWNIASINSIASLADELATQRLLNIVYTNAIASLANKLSDLITHLDDGR